MKFGIVILVAVSYLDYGPSLTSVIWCTIRGVCRGINEVTTYFRHLFMIPKYSRSCFRMPISV